MGNERAELRPIGDEDVDTVADFLHTYLNPKVTTAAWRALMTPPWNAEAPNHGFRLVSSGDVVGAYVAVYAARIDGDHVRRFCNLAAFCVREEYRAESLRLIRAVLRQPGYEFTDLSPSGNVVALNERLGFRHLVSGTRLSANLPALSRRGVRLITDPEVIAQTLRGRDASVFDDHRRAAAARHLVVSDGETYAYVVFRRDRRKGLSLFATPLYAGGDRGLLARSWPRVRAHLLLRHGLPATLAEQRILGFIPTMGVDQVSSRPKMYRGDAADLQGLDYMYSELALIQW